MVHPGEDKLHSISPASAAQPERLWADMEKLRGVAEVEPRFYPVLGGL